jgi:hypothetical protein
LSASCATRSAQAAVTSRGSAVSMILASFSNAPARGWHPCRPRTRRSRAGRGLMSCGALWSAPLYEQRLSGHPRASSLPPCEPPRNADRRCCERRRVWSGATTRCGTRSFVAHVPEPARPREIRGADGASCACADPPRRRTWRSGGSPPLPCLCAAEEAQPRRAWPWRGQSRSSAAGTLLRVRRGEHAGPPRVRTRLPVLRVPCLHAWLFAPSRP